MPSEIHAIIFFDGFCNLCNWLVRFIIRHDKKKYFLFASLQSEISMALLADNGYSNAENQTVLLLENNKIYQKSTAALHIARKLDGICKTSYIFIFIPERIRNFLYGFVAGNRYKWFGKKDQCMMPSEDLKYRFIC